MGRRRVRGVVAVVAMAVLATGLSAVDPLVPATPASASTGAAPGDTARAVPGETFTPLPPPEDDARRYAVPETRVPESGRARVAVGPDATRAGGLPIAVAQAASAVADPGPGAGAPPAAAAPSSVVVEAFDQATVRRLGGRFVAFDVTRADAADEAAPVAVEVDYSGFARAFGGDFFARLRIVEVPACALTTPEVARCAERREVEFTNDLDAQVLRAEVAAEPATAGTAPGGRSSDSGDGAGDDATAAPTTTTTTGGSVYVVASGASSSAGDYRATPLAPSAEWQVGLQSGAFSWSWPVPLPPATVGNTPSLDFSYSSQSVDGLTAASSSQPGWMGLGWDLTGLGYIERRYIACATEQGGSGVADLCWHSQNATIVLDGRADELVPTGSNDEWRLRHDPGWRVQRLTGATNGDNDGEYWVVTTPDGTKYWFGKGQTSAGQATESAWTVPVFGNDVGDPCRGSQGPDWCQQAWRWNLDRITDTSDNEVFVFWKKELNHYGRGGMPGNETEYVRGGHPDKVVYSRAAGTTAPAAASIVKFNVAGRCTGVVDGQAFDCTATPTSAPAEWPDVPVDLICAPDDGEQCFEFTPTFFTTKLLRSVYTFTRDAGGTIRAVDAVDLDHGFPDPSAAGDPSDPKLFLSDWHRIADPTTAGNLPNPGDPAYDGTDLVFPDVDPQGVRNGAVYDAWLANRADHNLSLGVVPLRLLRVTAIRDELGGEVRATYGQPDASGNRWGRACDTDDEQDGPWDANVNHCFPLWFAPDDQEEGVAVNNKFLVTQVELVDTRGTSPTQTWRYTYTDGPGWHHDEDPVRDLDRQTWSDWRGHSKVTVTTGDNTVTRTSYLFFRGMNGDRLIGGGVRSATVVDSQGVAMADDEWLAGRQREVRQMATTTAEVGATVHTYHATVTAVDPGDAGRWAVMATAKKVETRTARAGTTPLRTVTESAVDGSGYPTYTLYSGDTATTGDERCLERKYVRKASAWLMDRISWTATYGAATGCLTGAVSTADLVAKTVVWFDAMTSYTDAANLTRGLPTEVHTYTANSATWVSTETTYDAHGRPVAVTNPLGRTTTTSYFPTNAQLTQTVTVTDAASSATVTTLDRRRLQPLTVTDPNARTTTTAYDAAGRVTSIRLPSEPAGIPTYEFAYHLGDDPATTGVAEVPRIRSRQLLDASGATPVYTESWSLHDGLGRVRETQVPSPGGAGGRVVTATHYGTRGQVIRESQPYHNASPIDGALAGGVAPVATLTLYDEVLRPETVTLEGDGQDWSSTTTYDGWDRVTESPEGRATRYTDDAYGRLARVQELHTDGSLYATTTYRYDAADRLTGIVDPGGNTTTNTYDLAGRRVAVDDPDLGQWTFQYDANGNQVAAVDAAGVAVHTTFDVLDRPVTRRKNSPTGTKLAEWSYYDTAPYIGRLRSSTSYDGVRAYTTTVTAYDARYRPTAKDVTVPAAAGAGLGGTYTYTYGYDAADHVTSIGYPQVGTPGSGGLPAETVTFDHSDLGLPTTSTGTDAYVTATAYGNDGKLVGRTLGSGTYAVTRAYAYTDPAHRLSGLTATVGASTVVQDDDIAYDRDGNVTSIVDGVAQGQVQCFDHDHRSRLVQAWTTSDTACGDGAQAPIAYGPSPYNQAWTYTTVGTIATATDGTTTRAYGYGGAAAHALTSVTPGTGGAAADTYGHDANGALSTRTVAGTTSTFAWTPDHRLQSVTTGTDVTRFVYDPDGQRILRDDPGGAATLYLEGQELRTTGTSTSATRYYTVGGTAVALRTGDGTLYWLLANHQGSATVAVKAGSANLKRQRYLPYGAARGQANQLPTERGFLGQTEDDGTGLTYLNARYYDPATGQFASVDPLLVPSEPKTLAPYLYAGGNPVTFADLLGLAWCDGYYCGSSGNNGSPGRNTSSYPSYTGNNVGKGTSQPDGGHVNHWVNRTARTVGLDWEPIRGEYVDPSPPEPEPVPLVVAVVAAAVEALNPIGGCVERSAGGCAMDGLGLLPPFRAFRAVDAAIDAVDTARDAERAIDTARDTARGFGGLSRAGEFGVKPYSALRRELRGTGLQAHHLIEQRFADVMGETARRMPAVAVTPAEHQVFTNRWRALIPYGSGTASATRTEVMDAARDVYADHPEIIRALGL